MINDDFTRNEINQIYNIFPSLQDHELTV